MALAAVSGVLLFASLPAPRAHPPLAWIALVPLLLALSGSSAVGGALLGLVAGLCFLAPLLRFVGMFGALPWLSLATAEALFVAAFGAVVANILRRRVPWAVVPALAAAWSAVEFLRGHAGAIALTLGDLGYSQATVPAVRQAASLGSHYGVGYLVALVNAALAWFIVSRSAARTPWERRSGVTSLLAVAVLLGVVVLWGRARCAAPPVGEPFVAAVMQGNFSADVDAEPDLASFYRQQSLTIYDRLTARAAADGAELVVWPETAVPVRLNRDTETEAAVGAIARRHDLWVVAGTFDGGRHGELYNSAWLFTPRGQAFGRYSKRRLVMFGEYVPFRKQFPWLERYPIRDFDFSAGHELLVLRAGPARLGPLICYESLFPELTREVVGEGAEVVVILTSDAWAERSRSELAQHAACSVFRAVESGRYVLRAAKTGVTWIVSPTGRVLDRVPLFIEGCAVARVAALQQRTPYQRYGNWPLLLIWSISLMLPLLGRGTHEMPDGSTPVARVA